MVLRALPHPIRQVLFRIAVRLGLYPSIHLSCMPFKTVEYRRLVSGVRFRGTERVLDLGCGIGTQTILIGRRCASILGVDVSPDAIATARAMARKYAGLVDASFHLGPVEQAGLPTASFDRVLSFCVIEHIPQRAAVLAELHRLLKPGGDLILSADSLAPITDPELRARHARENHVVKYYDPASLRTALATAGFRDIQVRTIFRSRLARRLFEGGIRTRFQYGLAHAWWQSWRLRLHDALTPRDRPGIFLIAHARR